MQVLNTIFTEEQLSYLRDLPAVTQAYEKLSTQNMVYFSVPVDVTIKEALYESFGIDLFGIQELPFRWIKGDTVPHIDRGQTEFNNTYLVYLTDGEGQFHLGEESYPIGAGTGYSFSEGLSHSVVGTNGGSRLLLGPMSEQGLAVGGFNIYADGATDTVYIADIAGTVSYKINDGDWFAIPFACYVGNSSSDPTNNILKVLFSTDITLTSWNQNFFCGTSGIQFGSATLNADGSRPTITVNNAPLFRGLILNGQFGAGGYENIYIYNLHVVATGTSTLDDGTYLGKAGWIGGAYFGQAAINNYIVNCSSDGPIGDSNGGIVGAYAGSGSESGGSLTIRGCSSSGASTQLAGGIVGAYAGSTGGSITCDQCFTTGTIGDFAGGIFGDYAGDGGSASATKCYTTGTIGGNGGGIYGRYAGNNGQALAEKCYSRGNIGADGGGIFGLGAASPSGLTSATNCYSAGSITTSGTGIYGSGKGGGASTTNCYSANGSWNSVTANANLQGVPGANGVGATWVSGGADQPYELNAIGYSPYTLTNIKATSQLNQSFTQTIQAGQTTSQAVAPDASGNDFTILQITGGDSASYSTITMSSQTGAITTTSATVPETYTITLRSVGSYNITVYILLVAQGSPPEPTPTTSTTTTCCQSETLVRDISYEWMNDYKIGRRLIVNVAQKPNLQFNDYSEYVKYKMALGSGKI